MFMYILNCFPTMCLWLSTGTPGSKSAFFACVMCIYLLIVFEIAVFMYVFPTMYLWLSTGTSASKSDFVLV